MTDLRKAAEMALDALETLWDILDDIDTASDIAKENDAWYRKRVEALQKKRWDTMITTDGYKLKDGPVEALRQALAQDSLRKLAEIDRKLGLFDEPKQPEQEQYVTKVVSMHEDGTYITERIPLPKREWVGLTDDEMFNALLSIDAEIKRLPTGLKQFAKAIEAKLKEKNCVL